MEARSIDVAVLGGGAAGLMAAIRARRHGASVEILEKNRKCGAKILISGGGRCNLTTTREGSALLASFRAAQASFLKPSFAALSPQRLRAFFEEREVATVEEELEKVFPAADRASVVLEALLAAAEEAGVVIHTQCAVQAVEPVEGLFRIRHAGGEVLARRVILATGGKSWPRAGTTGDGYGFAKTLGHTVTRLFPALAPLHTPDPVWRALSGLTLGSCTVSVEEVDGTLLCFERPVLFTHEGLSGPGPMDVSGTVEARGGATIMVDLLPAISAPDLDALLAERARKGVPHVEGLLPDGIPQRLRPVLLQRAGIAPGTRAGELPRDARRALSSILKRLEFKIPKSLGFDHAEVTRGGVALDEVNPRTLESRIQPGFHVVGEVLDIDGPIGGFNFQAAFATGWAAGDAVAGALQRG